MDDVGSAQRVFYPTTIWSEVRRASGAGGDGSTSALEALLKRYYRPLQLHLEFKFRLDPCQSADWLQEFIRSKVLLGDVLSRASRDRGRFRTFLLNTLDNFVLSELRREHAKRRRPIGGFLSVEELVPETSPALMDDSPDQGTLEWARMVVAETIARMQAKCESKGCRERWGVFAARLLTPYLEGGKAPDYETLVGQFGFPSPAEAANALVTAKRMFQSTLREVVGEYAGEGADVEDEIRSLKQALAHGA